VKLSDLALRQVAFELRYTPAYLLWDRAGAVHTAALQKWHSLRVIRAEPGVTVFRLPPSSQITVTLERTTVETYKPDANLLEFIELSHFYTENLVRELGVSEFLRIGTRLIYAKTFPTIEEASQAILETRQVNVPAGKHFNIEGKGLYPEYTLRWEGEKTAVAVRLRAVGQKVEFDAPFAVEEIASVHTERFDAIFDVDHFTGAATPAGQFRCKDWIQQAVHLTRRDSGAFLGG